MSTNMTEGRDTSHQTFDSDPQQTVIMSHVSHFEDIMDFTTQVTATKTCPICSDVKLRPDCVDGHIRKHVKAAVKVSGTVLCPCFRPECVGKTKKTGSRHGHCHCLCGAVVQRHDRFTKHVQNCDLRLKGHLVRRRHIKYSMSEAKPSHESQFGHISDYITQINDAGECPLCPGLKLRSIQRHAMRHVKAAVEFKGTTFCVCYQRSCKSTHTSTTNRNGHYHCLCSAVINRKTRFSYHLKICSTLAKISATSTHDANVEPCSIIDTEDSTTCDANVEPCSISDTEDSTTTRDAIPDPCSISNTEDSTTTQDAIPEPCSISDPGDSSTTTCDANLEPYSIINPEDSATTPTVKMSDDVPLHESQFRHISDYITQINDTGECPLCPGKELRSVQRHAMRHVKAAVEFKGTTFCVCYKKSCKSTPTKARHGHYHCLCNAVVYRKTHFSYHLKRCSTVAKMTARTTPDAIPEPSSTIVTEDPRTTVTGKMSDDKPLHESQFGHISDYITQINDTGECPLCPGLELRSVQRHAMRHVKAAVEFKGTTFCVCYKRSCKSTRTSATDRHGHYHCSCSAVVNRKTRFTYHLKKCTAVTKISTTTTHDAIPEPCSTIVQEDSKTTSEVSGEPCPITDPATGIIETAKMSDALPSHESQFGHISDYITQINDTGECPLCPGLKLRSVQRHAMRHVKAAVIFKGTTFNVCYQRSCKSTPTKARHGHYHCLCSAVVNRRTRFGHHLKICSTLGEISATTHGANP